MAYHDMNRWDLYSFLKKRNGQTDMKEIRRNHAGIPDEELVEGIMEYNEMARHNAEYFQTFKIKEEK